MLQHKNCPLLQQQKRQPTAQHTQHRTNSRHLAAPPHHQNSVGSKRRSKRRAARFVHFWRAADVAPDCHVLPSGLCTGRQSGFCGRVRQPLGPLPPARSEKTPCASVAIGPADGTTNVGPNCSGGTTFFRRRHGDTGIVVGARGGSCAHAALRLSGTAYRAAISSATRRWCQIVPSVKASCAAAGAGAASAPGDAAVMICARRTRSRET